MKTPNIFLILCTLFSAGILSAATIVNSVDELSFSYDGGTSEVSAGGGSLTINTSKNSSAFASLPNGYQLQNVGDTMSVTLSLALDNVMSDNSSSFTISFSDSNTASSGGTIWDSTYNFDVDLDPVTTGNGIQFGEGDDNNLGKFNMDQAFGTSTHTMTFGLERTAADELSLSYSSPTLSSTTRTVQNDVIPVQTFTFDTFGFEFRGDGFSEDFSGSTIDATISSLTVDTTGAVIPEPSSIALLVLAFGSLYLFKHRK